MVPVSIDELLTAHEAIFLDAYGVLVDGHGALAGAREFIARLEQERRNYFVLTNDASRLPATLEARFRGFGLPIPQDRIVSSGNLLPSFFASRSLAGARCVVLGPHDSHALVANAGGVIVPYGAATDFDVLVVCDESGFPFLQAVEDVLSMVIRKIETGSMPLLVLPNPDLVYPKRPGEFGFAAGTIARMLEEAIHLRFPNVGATFLRLGKPHAPIFEEGCRRAGTRNAVMIGDQLETDIRGAHQFGISSALVGFGVTRASSIGEGSVRPTYLLAGWGAS